MNDEQIKALNLLKTARGQIENLIGMLEDERYCIDVSNQIMAVNGLLKKANLLILKQHMAHCVVDAFESGNGDEKIDEVIRIIEKVMK